MSDTFNPEHRDDGNNETRWHHVESDEPTGVSVVLSGSEGGAGSDVETSVCLSVCGRRKSLSFFLMNAGMQ